MPWDPFGIREARDRKLSEEERKEVIADPGLSWKDWAIYQGLKTWVGLALFIGDCLLFAGLWTGGSVAYRISIAPAMAGAIYLNYLLWSYLWYVPDIGQLRKAKQKRTLLHPFPVGRWTPEYETYKKSGLRGLHAEEVNPEEFL